MSEAEPWYRSDGQGKLASIVAATTAILICPEFGLVTVIGPAASAYIPEMEPTLEQMARSLVESGEYRITSRLGPLTRLEHLVSLSY